MSLIDLLVFLNDPNILNIVDSGPKLLHPLSSCQACWLQVDLFGQAQIKWLIVSVQSPPRSFGK